MLSLVLALVIFVDELGVVERLEKPVDESALKLLIEEVGKDSKEDIEVLAVIEEENYAVGVSGVQPVVGVIWKRMKKKLKFECESSLTIGC